MVVVIEKKDEPPIEKTVEAYDRVQKHAQKNFEPLIDDWWKDVKKWAYDLCTQYIYLSGDPEYLTGSLRKSIRIEKLPTHPLFGDFPHFASNFMPY